MDITLGELNKMSITKLKAILKKLAKEPKNDETLTTINIIENLILNKKRNGLILHPEFVKTEKGTFRARKPVPINCI